MARGGYRPGSGRKSWRQEFDAKKMLESSAAVLEETISAEKVNVSEEEKERRRVATEVFKKLAPSSINIGGQPNNPLSVVNLITTNGHNSNPTPI